MDAREIAVEDDEGVQVVEDAIVKTESEVQVVKVAEENLEEITVPRVENEIDSTERIIQDGVV